MRVAYSGHCIGAAAAALCGLLCEQSLGSILLWLPIEWKVVVSFLKLVEWLAPVAGGKLSSILAFLVQQLLEGFQSCDLPMLEKYGPALQISSKPKTPRTYKWKKALWGERIWGCPLGQSVLGVAKFKNNSCMGVSPNPCTSTPSLLTVQSKYKLSSRAFFP